VALGTAFLITWSNLAVGIIGNENEPINLIFFGVILIAIVGAFLARSRPRGLAWAMAAAGAAQAVTVVAAVIGGHFEAAIIAVFMTGWLMSAWLFRAAAAEEARGAG